VKSPGTTAEALEIIAWTLLRRYGVVFRRLLERETLLLEARVIRDYLAERINLGKTAKLLQLSRAEPEDRRQFPAA
jgi:hypothetical protein